MCDLIDLEYINNGERNNLKATRTEVNSFRLKDRMYLRIVELVWMGWLIGFSISRITSDFVDTGMLGRFEGLDIYRIFLREILRDVINSRRDLKLVMERKAKIEGNETIVFGASAQTICSIFIGE